MKFKAIIFDMDGTIVDTNPIWNKTVVQLAQRKGITDQEVHKKIQDAICGLSVTPACKLIKELSALPDSLEQIMKEKMEIALSLYADNIDFISGFPEFHQEIKQLNIPSAIATNADDSTFEITKRTLQLHQFFGEHMYNISCVGNVCKPNPDIYLHAAQKLGFAAADCIAIEDSAPGILAAKRAGMKCIGINTNKDRSALQAADHIIEGYAELTCAKLEELL